MATSGNDVNVTGCCCTRARTENRITRNKQTCRESATRVGRVSIIVTAGAFFRSVRPARPIRHGGNVVRSAVIRANRATYVRNLVTDVRSRSLRATCPPPRVDWPVSALCVRESSPAVAPSTCTRRFVTSLPCFRLRLRPRRDDNVIGFAFSDFLRGPLTLVSRRRRRRRRRNIALTADAPSHVRRDADGTGAPAESN